MNSEKYIGLDVHRATICVAVMDPKSMGFECYLVTTVIGSHLQRDAKRKAAPDVERPWCSRKVGLLFPYEGSCEAATRQHP
jgi:hypothetical protein